MMIFTENDKNNVQCQYAWWHTRKHKIPLGTSTVYAGLLTALQNLSDPITKQMRGDICGAAQDVIDVLMSKSKLPFHMIKPLKKRHKFFFLSLNILKTEAQQADMADRMAHEMKLNLTRGGLQAAGEGEDLYG